MFARGLIRPAAKGIPERMTRILGWVGAASVLLLAGVVGAAERKVTSAAEIERAVAEAKPGDTIVIADGDWKNQIIALKARGSAEKPITMNVRRQP